MSSNRQVDPMFNRRAIMAAGGGALLFGGLIARLFQLQILNREKYQLAAADNSVKLELAPPSGDKFLIASDGLSPLTGAQDVYRLYLSNLEIFLRCCKRSPNISIYPVKDRTAFCPKRGVRRPFSQS